MAFKFEDLRVWQKSVEFSLMIHSVTQKFPKDELFILTPQIKRAADSISLNIAEGSTGQSNAEFCKFLGYALRSAIEVITCLHLAKKRFLIGEEDFNSLYNFATEIVKMVQGLRNTLKNA